MSLNYTADTGAAPVSPYTTAELSLRDLGLQVPINFVTTPGVSLAAACFGSYVYEDAQASNCLANLLSVGFRRFILDLYWDQQRGLWSFCPVAIPPSDESAVSSASVSTSSSTTVSPLSYKITSAASKSSTTLQVEAHDDVSTTSANGIAASSLGTVTSSLAVNPTASSGPVISDGNFTCTPTINLSAFTSLLLSYIQTTENTLAAHLLYVVLNIHAASNASDPFSPAPAPTALPAGQTQLGSIFSSNFSAYMYTPSTLASDRANLNASWYKVSESNLPAEGYYSTTTNSHGIRITEGGWPTEHYIEFTKAQRLLVGWGTIDPQMEDYDLASDKGKIFSSGILNSNISNISAMSSGRVTNGCFLASNGASVSDANSSWAAVSSVPGFEYASTAGSDITPSLDLASNLTSCGLSAVLNSTLCGTNAHQNYIPYQNYSYSTIWAWAPGEPANHTAASGGGNGSGNDDGNGSGGSGGDDDSSSYRCATISTSASSARWRVADCSTKLYAACRAPSSPYNWTLTADATSYKAASAACASPYAFAAPRTALENAYLGQAIRALAGAGDFGGGGGGGDDDNNINNNGEGGVWVDFNSVDVEGCWTAGGINATCPYSADAAAANDTLQKQTVIVPTVAAIIVLVILLVTIWAKWAGYRRVRKRTRRRVGQNGFVYEGVPS